VVAKAVDLMVKVQLAVLVGVVVVLVTMPVAQVLLVKDLGAVIARMEALMLLRAVAVQAR
jgi:hypothetical protein